MSLCLCFQLMTHHMFCCETSTAGMSHVWNAAASLPPVTTLGFGVRVSASTSARCQPAALRRAVRTVRLRLVPHHMWSFMGWFPTAKLSPDQDGRPCVQLDFISGKHLLRHDVHSRFWSHVLILMYRRDEARAHSQRASVSCGVFVCLCCQKHDAQDQLGNVQCCNIWSQCYL